MAPFISYSSVYEDKDTRAEFFRGGFPYFVGSQFQRLAPSDRQHFVFVEEVTPITNIEQMDAPDGETICFSHVVMEHSPVRVRTSGPPTALFLEWQDQIFPLMGEEISPDDQARRRRDLVEFFAKVPMPVIDLLISADDDDWPALRLALQPGSWHVISFRVGSAAESIHPVLVENDVPEARVADGHAQAYLQSLAYVEPPVELRLRDIFSFNHIPDANIDDGDEDGHDPPAEAGQPLTPGGGQAAAVAREHAGNAEVGVAFARGIAPAQAEMAADTWQTKEEKESLMRAVVGIVED